MNDYAFWCLTNAKINPERPGQTPSQVRDVSVEQLEEAAALFHQSASIIIDAANRFENLEVVTGELARRKEFGKARAIVDKTITIMKENWPSGVPPMYFKQLYPGHKKVSKRFFLLPNIEFSD